MAEIGHQQVEVDRVNASGAVVIEIALAESLADLPEVRRQIVEIERIYRLVAIGVAHQEEKVKRERGGIRILGHVGGGVRRQREPIIAIGQRAGDAVVAGAWESQPCQAIAQVGESDLRRRNRRECCEIVERKVAGGQTDKRRAELHQHLLNCLELENCRERQEARH